MNGKRVCAVTLLAGIYLYNREESCITLGVLRVLDSMGVNLIKTLQPSGSLRWVTRNAATAQNRARILIQQNVAETTFGFCVFRHDWHLHLH